VRLLNIRNCFKDTFSKHKSVSLNLINTILLALLVSWYICQNTPTALATPPTDKLQCVSYAPYYKNGQTPFDAQMMISETQIEQDLAFLSQQFSCVRTYSVNQGLDHVPVAASKLGMQVMLGAWIGWTESENIVELNKAVALANTYPDTIKALIIGNEVLLRREQTEATLKRYLNIAKAATQTPVTYADVWEFWRKHPTLEAEVDFVTAHILPYWEDDPQSVDVAIKHTTDVMAIMATSFKKPIFIGETGWPSEGRQRNASLPSHVNQAKYIRDFLKVAHEKKWNYNLIEAIDQPWKRKLEGTVGGYWGIYNTDLTPKFSFSENIAERADGVKTLSITAVAILVFVALGAWLKLKIFSQYIHLLLLGALAGLSAVIQIEYLISASRSSLEWLYLGGLVLLSWLMLLALAVLTYRTCARSKQVLSVGFLILLVTALITNLTLVFDGRYINYPLALYALICLQLLIASLLTNLSFDKLNLSDWVTKWFLWALILSAVGCLYQEQDNLHAMLWLAVNIALVITFRHSQRPTRFT
jgi:exo-beta-1,3-glucanase (GH17 family)